MGRRLKGNIDMKLIKNAAGLFFVKGKGFCASIEAEATAFSAAEVSATQDCMVACGLERGTVVDYVVPTDPNIKQNANGVSFAVSYVRSKQLRADGSINTHKLNPSKRRFATHDEATHHGRRFMAIEKHLGFYVTQTKDPVNAYVNKVTGKTNPEIGKKRTNR